MSFLRRWFKRLGIVLASTALALLGVEGYLRAAGMRPPQRPYSDGDRYHRDAAPPLNYDLRPDVVPAWIYPGSGSAEDRRIVANINSLGFRGPEASRSKPEGALRVICLGDSMTFGVGVQDAETWPARLREGLAAELPERRVEVWNCGVPGYDTVQEVTLFARRLQDAAPDVVVLAYYANDAKGEGLRLRPLGAVAQVLFDLTREQAGGFAGELRSVSWLAELAAQRLARSIMESRNQDLWDRFHSDESTGWTDVRRELRRARDLCAEVGARLLVVPYPQMQKEGEHLSTHDAYQRVFAFCAGEAIATLDVESQLEGLEHRRMWAHPLDNHPSAEVQAIFAREVGRRLVEDRFFARSPVTEK